MKCIEITIKINEIKSKKAEFDILHKVDTPNAMILKKDIQVLINQLKEILPSFFTIEGKRFPVLKLEIGGKSAKELENELLSKYIKLSNSAKDILYSSVFTTLPNSEQIKLVRLEVGDLGLPDSAYTKEIYAKAQELGLELCPAEVGPHQRLKDEQRDSDDWYLIAMKPITDRDGDPFIFSIDHNSLWLSARRAAPLGTWSDIREFIFRVPKKNNKGGS